MKIIRKKTREIRVGNVKIGGDNPISIQSMTNTDTRDISSTTEQIKRLTSAGCDLIRVAVPDSEAAEAVGKIIPQINIPLIADIHFDHKLALMAIESGVDGLRLNPGNISNQEKVCRIVDTAGEHRIPIRIGVNGGSLPKDILNKYGHTSTALVESALRHIQILERLNFHDIKVSVKTSSVPLTIESYRLLSKKIDYPLHLGITEAGTEFVGTIRSSIGIGTLLAEGIGDTIRVSLTADPILEIKVAKEILKSLDLRKGLRIISCPTCGRTEIDIIRLTDEVEKMLKDFAETDLTVAVMGCVVNGPGEAKEADFAICGGKSEGLIFKAGEFIKKVPESALVEELFRIINEHIDEV